MNRLQLAMIYFDVSVETCKKRNKIRKVDHFVDHRVIEKMAGKIEPPANSDSIFQFKIDENQQEENHRWTYELIDKIVNSDENWVPLEAFQDVEGQKYETTRKEKLDLLIRKVISHIAQGFVK